MATTKIEGVYEIKIEQGPALRAFEEVKKRLDNTKASIRDLNKANKELIAAEQQITAAIKAEGTATTAQAKQLAAVQASRSKLNQELAEAVLNEKALSAQSRELSNDLSGLTANGLRFRDKMADANLEALKGSGILGQLAAQERSLKVELEGVNQKLQSGTITQEQYDRELKKINASVDGVKSKSVQLEAELTKLNEDFRQGAISQKQYQDGLRNIEQQTAGLSQKFDSFVSGQGAQLKSTLSSLATSYIGVGAAIYGVTRLFASAQEISERFEASQSNLAAIMGVTKAEIVPLTEDAKRYGATTAFTASQVTELQTELGKLGFSMSQVREATPAVLDLAAATGTSLGNAATIAAQTLNAFNLPASETARIVDVIAKSANLSAFDIDTFSSAMSNAAPSAKAVGVEVEQAAAMLSALVDAGIPAEKAGTDLRNIFIELEAKGLTMDQAFEQIRGSTDKLSVATELFGKRSGSSGIILADNTEKLARLEDAYLNASGAAEQMAKTQLDNLRGDKLLLTSAWEGFVLSVEDGSGIISKVMRSFTQSLIGSLTALTDLSNGTKSFSEKAVALQQTLTGLSGGATRKFVESFFTPEELAAVARGEKEVADRARVMSKDFDVSGASVEDLSVKLRALTKNRDEYAKLSNQQAAVESYDAQISAVKRIIEAKKQEAASNEIVAKSAAAQAKESTDAIDEEGKSLGQLRAELKQAKRDRDDLNETDVEGIDNANATIKSIEAQIKALEGRSTATKDVIKNATGSVADLQDQISKLQTQQAQSTSSAQFATYESQIKTLSEEVDILTGKLTREFLDAANAIPERIAPRNPEPQIVSGADKLNTELLGLNPNAPELVGKSLAEVQDLLDAAALNRLQESANLNDQLLALEIQWKDGSIKTYQEYADARAKIEADISEKARASQEADLQAVSNGLAAVQSLVDASFDGKLQRLDQQNADLNDKLRQATTDEQKELIKRDIERTAQEKKQLQARKEAAKGFGVIAALINTYQAANAAFVSQLVPGDPSSLPRATAAAVYATIAGLLNVAKLQGLAEGGEVGASGTVTPAWGQRVNRGNGDNVLVSTRKGYVTLRTGEKVLNDQQQQRLESIAGPSVWGAIGLPGHGTAKHYLNQAYADGGTIGIVTPRPSPSSIVSSQVAATMADFVDRPTYVDIHEVRSVNSRVEVTEQARTI